MIRTCLDCQDEFDDRSQEKRRVGGLITHCPQCSVDVPRVLGLQSADGKQSQITILQFESSEDRERYAAFWRNNTGYNVGKSCQLGTHLSTTPNVKFKSLTQFSPTNHKGKAQ